MARSQTYTGAIGEPKQKAMKKKKEKEDKE